MSPINGFALVSVLVFIEVFALLTLFSLHSASWETKMTTYRFQKSQLTQAALDGLYDAEKNIESTACQIPMLASTQWHQASLAWWQTHSCTGKLNLFQYYYVIESLPTDSCADMTDGRVAAYKRLTLLTVSLAEANIKVIYQTTLAIPVKAPMPCLATHHIVLACRQSFREINF